MKDELRIKQLYELACETRKLAYSPYSGFAVGAAIETKDGKVFTGCNVENGAYGLGICAEQAAITKAVSEGHREFLRIVVVASPLASPCGACRQVIGEFFDDEAMIYCFDAGDATSVFSWSMKELLPERFKFEAP